MRAGLDEEIIDAFFALRLYEAFQSQTHFPPDFWSPIINKMAPFP